MVDVALATVVANTLVGDPLWVLIVDPPSTGKTEYVQMFRNVPFCGWLSEVTENTFLSGLQRPAASGRIVTAREHSLLFRWTDPQLRAGEPPVRVILVQDLTGLITVRREKRDALFGQLRQIYDGRLTKSTGMGDDLLWEGYLGLLGAVTPNYDDVAELHSILGNRFVLYRPTRRDAAAEARKAIARAESAPPDWREMIANVAASMVRRALPGLSSVRIAGNVREFLIDLARLTAAGRAAVLRDGYKKTVKAMPEPEGPARLAQQFEKLLRGLCAVRGRTEPGEDELAIVAKVARDTMPAIRLRVLKTLYEAGGTKAQLKQRTGLPPSTVEYAFQDLTMLGVTKREGHNKTARFSDDYRELAARTGFFDLPNHEA